MDADTRHQLKHNELADALRRLRDLNNPQTRYMLLALAALLVLVLGWRGWRYSREQALESASQRLARAETSLQGDAAARAAGIAEVRALIAEVSHPGLLAAARLQLARGLVNEAHDTPERRAAALTEAATAYEQVVNAPDSAAPFAAAARFGLASTFESLAAVENDPALLEKARAAYEALLDDPRAIGSPFVQAAKDRLASLDKLDLTIAFAAGEPPTPLPQGDPAAQPIQLTPEEIQELLGQRPVQPAPLPGGALPERVPIPPEGSTPPPAAEPAEAPAPDSPAPAEPAEPPAPESPAPAEPPPGDEPPKPDQPEAGQSP